MPVEPYIVLGFDVDPADPNHDQILADVEANFPDRATLTLTALAVRNTYVAEVGEDEGPGIVRGLIRYFRAKDLEHNDALRWFVQLCRSAEGGFN